MNTRPAGARVLVFLLLWLAALVVAWHQTTGPVPARDSRWGDLLTLQGWAEPVGLNAALKAEAVHTLLPAPWLILVNLIAAALFFRFGIQHAKYVRTKQPLLGGIHDAPIEDLQSDRLQRAPLVRSLAQLFRNVGTKPPLAVALSAPWGVGKSSVLGMLKTELQSHARCVYINPWHYPQDSQLLAALMTGICKEAVPPMLSWANVVFRINLLWQRVLVPHWRWFFAAGLLFFFFIWEASSLRAFVLEAVGRSAFAHVVPAVQQTWLNMLDVLPATLQAWAGEGVKALLALPVLLLFWRKGLQRLQTFSPSLTRALAQSAQWAAKSMSLPDWSQHAGLRHQFAQDFREIAQAFGPQRLVLLIDDLDRCEPHQVAQTLATLNFVFTNQAPCFVVLAMDKNYVEHALGLAYKDMALAMREGQAQRDAQTQCDSQATADADLDKPKAEQNQACLSFARQYVRKLVQIEINLSHDTSQGALMVLDALHVDESHSQKPANPENTASDIRPSWRERLKNQWHSFIQKPMVLWCRAWCRYLRVQLCKGCRHTVNAIGYLNWKRLQLWRWSVLKQNLGAVVLQIGAVVKVGVFVLSVLLGWMARGLGLGFKTVLDARLHHWVALGNVLWVAVGSYVVAVLVTGLITIAIPTLVPKTVQNTAAQAATSQDAKGANTPTAETAAPEPKPPAEVQKRESEGSGHMEVLPPDANAAEPWWLSINWLAFIIFGVIIATRAQQTVRDSEGFLLAVRHWHQVLSPRFPNPREWKRLSNMARFLAMRVRADQYQSRSQQLSAWWQEQLRWAQAVISTPKGTALPRPGVTQNNETFRLSEGAAVELWMLDCLCGGHLRTDLFNLMSPTQAQISTPQTPISAEKHLSRQQANEIEQCIISCYARQAPRLARIENYSHCGPTSSQQERIAQIGRVLDFQVIGASPNLRPLFFAWDCSRQDAESTLRQWLAWTRDLRMDLQNDDKPN